MDELEKLHAEYVAYLPLKAEDEKRLWTKLRLDWNYNSNRIEGNTLTYGETEALLILGTEPRRLAKDIREMKAHDLAISHVLDLAKDERPLTQADVRNLNKIALKEPYFVETQTADGNVARKEIIPGEYKTLQNHVTLRGGGLHKFAEPHEVPARMEDTISLIRDFIGSPNAPLPVFLAKLHQDFIQTHPFDDGNGRVVRMLLNYVLIKLGWLPICIKDSKKKDYLAALERADNGDISDLERIMESEIEWSLRKAIAAAKGESVDDAGDLDKEIRLFVREKATVFDHQEEVTENVSNKLQDDFFIIYECLSDFTSTFSDLFKSYHERNNWTDFEGDKVIKNSDVPDCYLYGSLSLEDWRALDVGRSVKIYLKFLNKDTSPAVEVAVEVWMNRSMGPDRLLAECNVEHKDGIFKYKNTDQPDIFAEKIKTAIFSEIKNF